MFLLTRNRIRSGLQKTNPLGAGYGINRLESKDFGLIVSSSRWNLMQTRRSAESPAVASTPLDAPRKLREKGTSLISTVRVGKEA